MRTVKIGVFVSAQISALSADELVELKKRKLQQKEARRRARMKADPIRSARHREQVRDSKRRQMMTKEGRERHRVQNRAAVRRLRMVNPNYAVQWERDNCGRWYRAAKSADGTVTREFVKELETEIVCPYCLEQLIDTTRVFDHVEPIARGGSHSASNLAACCATCNQAKGKLRLIEFLIRRCGAT